MENKKEQRLLQLLPYNDPLLRIPTETVIFPLSKDDSDLINNMLYSVEDSQLAAAKAPWPSAAGMAAPQWGASRRIFVIQRQYLELSTPATKIQQNKFPGSDGFIVVINPKYEGLIEKEVNPDDTEETDKPNVHINMGSDDIRDDSKSSLKQVGDWEGCFSVPGQRGMVRRYSSITAEFSSMDGVQHTIVLRGWSARVFQHETDHTEGRLYDDTTANRCTDVAHSSKLF